MPNMSSMVCIQDLKAVTLLAGVLEFQSTAQKITKIFCHCLRKNALTSVLGLSLLLLVAHVSLPKSGSAAFDSVAQLADTETLELVVSAMTNESSKYGAFPVASSARARSAINVPVTAYSSEIEQTDSTPFITASGTRVHDGIVAANFLPIGTRVRFPDLYGEKIFIVEDRMNARYSEHVDIWMNETADAKNFGLRHTQVEIFPRVYNHARITRSVQSE